MNGNYEKPDNIMTQLAEHLHEIQASTRVRALNTYIEYEQTLACLHLATRRLNKKGCVLPGSDREDDS